VVARRDSGGMAALPPRDCLYRHAQDDGIITEADNPVRKVAKPRRLPSTRRAFADTRLAEINDIAATTGNDRSWTPCCCGCTPRPPAAGAARSPCAPRTWTRTSAWSCYGRRARRSGGSRSRLR
jgi:hypothetical protein